jgi:DNA primase
MRRSDMSKKRFSSQQLYCLRNELPIDMLIEKQLRMSCQIADGRFRFLCPLCGQFDTAVNRQTNLARCFGCGKNFNTIDLVMLTRKVDFVTGIGYLKALVENHHTLPNPQKTNHHRPASQPVHIGNILGSIAPTRRVDRPEARHSIHERIEALERKVELLTRQIKAKTESIE